MRIVAVLGASASRSKFGNKAVRAFRQCGWQVFPIHPREASIEGLPSFPSLDALPGTPHVVSVYLPPAVLLTELQALVRCRAEEVWLNPGTDTPEVLAAAERLGLRIVRDCTLLRLGVSPAAFED